MERKKRFESPEVNCKHRLSTNPGLALGTAGTAAGAKSLPCGELEDRAGTGTDAETVAELHKWKAEMWLHATAARDAWHKAMRQGTWGESGNECRRTSEFYGT